jgi:oligopeptide transport system ATP-binding protein
LELIKAVKERTNMAVIFITHNLAVIAEVCDKVSVMYGGYIVEQGSVEDIFYEPCHPYTKGLLRSMPRLDKEGAERLIPIEGTPINMLDPNPGCPFAPRCDSCMKVCIREMPAPSSPSGITNGSTTKGNSDTKGSATKGGNNHLACCWLLQPCTEGRQDRGSPLPKGEGAT